jgi:hypothetical protein
MGRETTVSVLLAAGQNTAARDCLHFTAVHWAIIGGRSGVVRCLLSETETQVPEKSTIPTLLQLAWWGGDEEILELVQRHYTVSVMCWQVVIMRCLVNVFF